MKVTMQQIADIAGVTRATVDKVVHNRPGVPPGHPGTYTENFNRI